VRRRRLKLVAALLFNAIFAFQIHAGEPDTTALQLYGLRLLQTGSKLRSYPQEAVERKISGTALVELAIDAHGSLIRQTLLQSSGHALLDEHALAMLAKAVPVTEIPGNLKNAAFTIRVAVAFALP